MSSGAGRRRAERRGKGRGKGEGSLTSMSSGAGRRRAERRGKGRGGGKGRLPPCLQEQGAVEQSEAEVPWPNPHCACQVSGLPEPDEHLGKKQNGAMT